MRGVRFVRLLFHGGRHVTKLDFSVGNTLASRVSLRFARLRSKAPAISERIGDECSLLCGCAVATAIVVGGSVVTSDAEAELASDAPYLRRSPDPVCIFFRVEAKYVMFVDHLHMICAGEVFVRR